MSAAPPHFAAPYTFLSNPSQKIILIHYFPLPVVYFLLFLLPVQRSMHVQCKKKFYISKIYIKDINEDYQFFKC